jgi:hypothetical protein
VFLSSLSFSVLVSLLRLSGSNNVSFSIFRSSASLFRQLLLFPFSVSILFLFQFYASFFTVSFFVCIVAALLRFSFLVVAAASVGVGVFCLGFGWFLVGHVDLVRDLWCW